RVAGEGGETLVRRVAVAGRRQGQDLPPFLTGAGQGLDPGVGRRSQVADAVGAGQGGGVQQHPRGTRRRRFVGGTCHRGLLHLVSGSCKSLAAWWNSSPEGAVGWTFLSVRLRSSDGQECPSYALMLPARPPEFSTIRHRLCYNLLPPQTAESPF